MAHTSSERFIALSALSRPHVPTIARQCTVIAAMQDAFTPARRSKSSGSSLAGAGAGGVASPALATSPPNGPAGRPEEGAAPAAAVPAAENAPGSSPAITGLSGAVAGASPLAAGAVAATTAAAVVAAANGAPGAGSPPSPPAPVARCLSDPDALAAGVAASLSAESSSSVLGAGATGAASDPGSSHAGLPHAKSTGALAEPSGVALPGFQSQVMWSQVHAAVACCSSRQTAQVTCAASADSCCQPAHPAAACRVCVFVCQEAAGGVVAHRAAIVPARGTGARHANRALQSTAARPAWLAARPPGSQGCPTLSTHTL